MKYQTKKQSPFGADVEKIYEKETSLVSHTGNDGSFLVRRNPGTSQNMHLCHLMQ